MNRRWLTFYQVAAGVCDAGTGLLLIMAPAWTLRLMRLGALPQPIAFASFVGAFVLPVGLSYFLVLGSGGISSGVAGFWRAQWKVTALVRTTVALVLAAEIALGRMETGWVAVALTDGLLAAIQWFGLGRGWLNHAE